MVSNINSGIPSEQLIMELVNNEVQVGMVEFSDKGDVLPVPNSFKKIGNFELDILAIDLNTNRVVMLDHDQPDCVIGKVSRNVSQLVDALKPIEKIFKAKREDDGLYDDFDTIRKVTEESSAIAGGEEYQWFYDLIFGI